MNKFTRTIAVVFFIVATLLPFVIVPVWLGGGWGWGMMGPGMMGPGWGMMGWGLVGTFFLLLFPAVLATLWVILHSGAKPPASQTCPSCGSRVPTDARFCQHCGKPLPK